MLFVIIAFVVGMMIGFGIATGSYMLYIDSLIAGTLKKQTDDGETYLFLDLDIPPEKILSRDRVMFRVDGRDMVTRK